MFSITSEQVRSISKSFMKKDIITHLIFTISLLLITSLVRKWFEWEFIPFWLGGLFGALLPDIDHLVYIYLLKPKEETSQKAVSLIQERQVTKTWDYIMDTAGDRKDLIFHTAFFQLLFAVFAFLIVTSSGSVFGRGLVLAFYLHLIIDQVVDLVEKGGIQNWFVSLPFTLDNEKQRWYVAGNIIVLLVLSLVF